MTLHIRIRNSADEPIYEQITQQIAQAITRGELAEGDALPSLRSLAKDLRVSVITTTRAYNELANQGLIVSVPGKGAFVQATHPELLRERHMAEIEGHLASALAVARAAGISRDDVASALNVMWQDAEDHA